MQEKYLWVWDRGSSPRTFNFQGWVLCREKRRKLKKDFFALFFKTDILGHKICTFITICPQDLFKTEQNVRLTAFFSRNSILMLNRQNIYILSYHFLNMLYFKWLFVIFNHGMRQVKFIFRMARIKDVITYLKIKKKTYVRQYIHTSSL